MTEPQAEAPSPPLPKRGRWLRRLIIASLCLALLAGGIVAAGLRWLDRWSAQSYGTGDDVAITIAPGTSAQAIAADLAGKDIIDSEALFLAWLRLHKRVGQLQAGEYRLQPPMSPEQVAEALGRGTFERQLTIPEGWTTRQIAERLLANGWISDRREWLDLVAEPARIDALEFELLGGCEGFLFPDTYRLEKGSSPADIRDRMLSKFAEQWQASRPGERDARSEKLTPSEVVILASMIQREARLEEEMPAIASVYFNRLKRGMKMQCCATVHYSLGEVWNRALTLEDLKVDSPYNTYLHAGLPPGPISNPGRAAIEAVLRPDTNDYLFYVYAGDGHHIFSRTHAEHVKAKRSVVRSNPQAAITAQSP